MRLPRGTIKPIQEITGIRAQRLSDYAAARKRPGRVRAAALESACAELGIDCPASVWLYGTSDEIKSRLTETGNFVCEAA